VPFRYSKDLIDRTITYFQKRGFVLSPEKASEYLESLAEVYIAFTDRRPVPPSSEADGSFSCDSLIT